MVRELGKVPGTNPSSRFSGQPEKRGHLEATTVRAFLVSAGFPTAGVTEEAHLHCRKCGRVRSHPIQGRQSGHEPAFRRSSDRRVERSHGSGVSTGWFHSHGRTPFVHRGARRSGIGEWRTTRDGHADPAYPRLPPTRRPDGPCLVVDLDVVARQFPCLREGAARQPDLSMRSRPIRRRRSCRLLAGLGSNFDTASVAEIEMALDAGATPDRISYGNTIKKERDIARAYALGVSPLRRRQPRGSREDRARRSRRPRLLPRADQRRGRRMAAVAQVRMRAADGRRRAGLRPPARPRLATACPSMSARR